MQLLRTATFAAGLLQSLLAPPAWAQIDYRNLDANRPVVTEDAYPVERYGFEMLAPYRFEAERGGRKQHLAVPELAYGIIRNAQLGLELPLAAVDDDVTGTDWGLAGLHLSGLYNLNTEGRTLPAVSLRADVGVPVGLFGGDATRFSLEAIATRSWGRLRTHINAGRGFGPEGGISAVDPLPRWRASAAADWTFFRSSFLLIGEIATSQATEDAPSLVSASLGGRWQWRPTLVLDLGLTRRLSELGPDFGITLGISHSFAIAALMPGQAR